MQLLAWAFPWFCFPREKRVPRRREFCNSWREVLVLPISAVAGSGKEKASLQQAFLLGDGLAPLPPKEVKKIPHLEFVDMAEMLWDNLEVQGRSVSQESQVHQSSNRSSHREIPDLLS